MKLLRFINFKNVEKHKKRNLSEVRKREWQVAMESELSLHLLSQVPLPTVQVVSLPNPLALESEAENLSTVQVGRAT